MQRIEATLGDAVFMQDNAPIHKVGIVEEWFDKMGFQVDEHPAYSPDLNPIDHVWVELKKWLQEQDLKISETPGGKEKVRQ